MYYWRRDDHREFITDPNGDVVNLARLTAYAEYGDVVHEREIHHEIPIEKPDAPPFLTPLTEEAHGALHGSYPEPREIDGIPRLRPDSS